MTDAVKGVSVQSVGYEDGQYRRSRLDRLKARALKTRREARSVFKDEKTQEYKQNIPELTNREAKSFGKKAMQNETAAARVDDRMVYIDQNKMNAVQSAMPDRDHVYISNEKVRKIIAENPEDFYIDGEFSSDQYKRRFGGFTGFDNKGNLDEIATASADYGVSKRTIRKAMDYAGYDLEKDLTWLYKSLAFLGVLGATAGTGALLGASFTSNVWGIHNDGSSELLDTIKSTDNSAQIGGLRGLLTGLIPAIALAAVVKDNGGKDIFKGNTAEEIVAKGEKNIESRIRGEKNQKMMKAILRMENISNEDKAFILKLAYGELTGKKVNDRELVAAYEIANFYNKHPELDPKDFDKLPGLEEHTVIETPDVDVDDEDDSDTDVSEDSSVDDDNFLPDEDQENDNIILDTTSLIYRHGGINAGTAGKKTAVIAVGKAFTDMRTHRRQPVSLGLLQRQILRLPRQLQRLPLITVAISIVDAIFKSEPDNGFFLLFLSDTS